MTRYLTICSAAVLLLAGLAFPALAGAGERGYGGSHGGGYGAGWSFGAGFHVGGFQFRAGHWGGQPGWGRPGWGRPGVGHGPRPGVPGGGFYYVAPPIHYPGFGWDPYRTRQRYGPRPGIGYRPYPRQYSYSYRGYYPYPRYERYNRNPSRYDRHSPGHSRYYRYNRKGH